MSLPYPPKYGLARLVLGTSAFLEISEQRYHAIKNAYDFLLSCLNFEKKYDILLENYNEFEMALLRITTNAMIFMDFNYHNFQDELNLINRHIINLLASGRTYIETIKHHVNTISSIDDNISINVNEEISKIYDNNISYRAIEALRNYALHRDFPIQALSHNQEWINFDTPDKKLRFATSPKIITTKLLEDNKFKRTIAHELNRISKEIDVKLLLREYITCISELHCTTRNETAGRTTFHESAYLEMQRDFLESFPSEKSTVGLAAVYRESQYSYTRKVEIFPDHCEYRRHFEAKNRRITNMVSRYASSEIVKPR